MADNLERTTTKYVVQYFNTQLGMTLAILFSKFIAFERIKVWFLLHDLFFTAFVSDYEIRFRYNATEISKFLRMIYSEKFLFLLFEKIAICTLK